MCRLISGLVTEQQVLIHPRSDSHTDCAEKYGLRDTETGKDRKYLKWECTPTDGLDNKDPATWEFVLDEENKDFPAWWCKSSISAIKKEVIKIAETRYVGVWPGDLDVRNTSNLSANALTKVGRNFYAREAKDLSANALTDVGRDFYADNTSNLSANALTKVGRNFYAREAKDLSANALIKKT